MYIFLGVLIVLSGAALAFGIWQVIGACLLVWFAVQIVKSVS